jgi:amino acid adenylation domain-containing protein/thioester reductase-like protein/non-ribosomal peptide synthase protein (TIGR01720 family)
VTTHALVEELLRRQVRLYVQDGQLRAAAPPGALTPALREALSARKAELMAALASPHALALPALERIARGACLPLSHGQERLWLLHQLEPSSTAYQLPFAVRLDGPLDVPALRAALAALIARHEVLRTRFVHERGIPEQRVEDYLACEVPFEVEADPLAPAQLGQWLAGESTRTFDLRRAPLLRARLRPLAASTTGPVHVLVLTLHHIVFDGWSLPILVRELGDAYLALAQGSPPSFAPLPMQYADYATFERTRLEGDWLREQLHYFREQLADAPRLELPSLRAAQRTGAARCERVPVELSSATQQQLRELARAHGTTLFVAMLTGLLAFLRRYCGQSDISIGTPVANRPWPELEGLIGFFANTLVLRSRYPGDPRFDELLRHSKQLVLDAQLHQHAPFERVVRELAPTRELGRTPLFRAALAFQHEPVALALGELQLTPLPVPRSHAMFDLMLQVTDQSAELEAGFEYNSELFDASAMARLSVHFTRFLVAAVRTPGHRLSELPLLAGAELAQSSSRSQGATRGPLSPDSTVDRFATCATARPSAVALRVGEQVVRYGELAARSDWLASELQARGASSEQPIAVCMERGSALIIALLACLKCGAYYVALDPHHPGERNARLLKASGARILLVSAHVTLRAASVTVLCVERFAEGAISGCGAKFKTLPRRPEQLVYQLFTSGSTGEPKGVMVPEQALLRLVDGQEYVQFSAREKFLHLAPLAFDASSFEIWGALLHGAELVLAPPHVLSLAELAQLIRERQVSVLWLTAGLFAQLVDHQLEALDGVRQLLAGGEVLSPAHVARAKRALPGCRIVNGYGPTENTTFSLFHLVGDDVDPHAPVPIGVPLAHSTAHVLDAQLNPVPTGVRGELYVGGLGVARGYAGMPDRTAERFVPDPFSERGARLYRTGDFARYREDGQLEFLGRADEQVKLRGHRIELGEVELALSGCTGVRAAAAAVYGRESARTLVAYIVGNAEPRALRQELEHQLPPFMVPSVFVSLEQLPLTGSGKLDRRALPAPDAARGNRPPLVPATETERALLALWQELLPLAPTSVDDDFFALGGHSLLALPLLARVRTSFGVDLPLRALFAGPTIAGLARAIERAREPGHAPTAPPLPAVSTGDFPLSYAQQQLWYEEQLSPQLGLYNIPVALRLDGPLDRHALAQSFAWLVTRHASLRTCFFERDGVAVQHVASNAEFQLTFSVLSGADASHAALSERIEREANQPFALDRPPLCRVQLFALGSARDPKEHVLLWTLHHAICDGASAATLLHELSTAYAALRVGSAPALPAPLLQYPDFVRWQLEPAQQHAIEQGTEHFRQKLAGAPPLLALPSGRARPNYQDHAGARYALPIGSELSERLRMLAARAGATPFVVMCAGFVALLQRVTGQRDLCFGTPAASRTRSEFNEVVGHFVNTVVLRFDLAGDPSFRELLCQVRNETLEAQTFQDVPFARVVEALGPRRDPGHGALIQVLFSFLAETALPQLANLRVTELSTSLRSAKFDLSVDVLEQGTGFCAVFEYAALLFEREEVARLAARYVTLLRAAADDWSVPISRLPIVTVEERVRLLGAARPERPVLADELIFRSFCDAVAAYPGSTAVVDGTRTWSYRQLASDANRIACQLHRLGVGPEVGVALHLPRSGSFVSALLGVLQSGGYYVPLDPSLPAARRRSMVQAVGATFVITDVDDPALHVLPGLRCLQLEDLSAPLPPGRAADSFASQHLDQLAYAIFTSGSTGVPKAASLTQRGLASALAAWRQAYGLRAGMHHLQMAQASFDVFGGDVVRALCSGGRLVLCPRETLLEPPHLLDLLEEQEIAIAEFVPAVLRPLLDYLETVGRTVDSVQVLICGSDHWSVEDYRRASARFPLASVVNSYGLTEATVDSLWFSARDTAGLTRLPLGKPYANGRAYVLDADLELTPIGVIGELYVGGEAVARGYVGRPELTAERFVPDPFGAPGARLYRTGDLARCRGDGLLELTGRVDAQVKLHGYRIELAEVEGALRRCRGVQAAAVSLRGGPLRPHLVGYVVGPEDFAALQVELRQILPDYMVPRSFVALAELPLTASGKLDRRLLPEPSSARLAAAPTTPLSVHEQLLLNLWQELLGVPSMSANDNFFELGGDSILAIQLVSRARHVGMVFTPRDLFANQTVASLARVVRSDSLDRAEQGLVAGPVPRTPIQHWFFEQTISRRSHWNLSVLVELGEPVDAAALQAACARLHAHHDALRICFDTTPSGMRARGTRSLCCGALWHIDLRATPVQEEAHALDAHGERAQASLDLESGKLWRLCWFDFGPARPARLLLIVHHLVSDAVSMRILLEDLQHAYLAARAGHAVELPAKTISYAAWATALTAQGSAPQPGVLDYYRVDAKEPSARLTPDWPGGRACEEDAVTVAVSLDARATEQLLRQAGRSYRTTPEELLLTAVASVLSSECGAPLVELDLEHHGRDALAGKLDVTRTVGWFTAVSPVRLRTGSSTEPRTLIRSVKEQLRTRPSPEYYGVLRYLGSSEQAAQLTATPPFSFNYLGRLSLEPAQHGFQASSGPRGHERDPSAQLGYELDLCAHVSDEQLQLALMYSGQRFATSRMQALGERILAALRELLEHCLAPGSFGYTPSDLPLARLTQPELDRKLGTRRDVADLYPLTPLQQGMLFHSLLDPSGGTYCEQLSCVLEGRLDPSVFARAVDELVAANPVLRTEFVWDGPAEPLQLVRAQSQGMLERQDLRALDAAGQAAQRDAYLAEDGVLNSKTEGRRHLRMALFRLTDERWSFALAHHHALLDGWSLGLLLGELFGRYAGTAQPVRRPFRDYVAWLHVHAKEGAREYFRAELAGWAGPTALGLPHGRAARDDEPRHILVETALAASIHAKLRAFCRAHAVTPNTVVQAAFALLLSHYASMRDVLFGVTVSGRPPELAGVEEMIGLFINTLPLRVRIDPSQDVSSFLTALQQKNVALREHEYLSLTEIGKLADRPPGEPLFDCLLVFENYPLERCLEGMADSLHVGEVSVSSKTNYALTLSVEPSAETMLLRGAFAPTRFSTAAAARLLERLVELIEQLTLRPSEPVGNLVCAPAEPLVLSREADFIPAHQRFEAVAMQSPHALALVCAEQSLCYGELNARANRLAACLRERGVHAETPVALYLPRSVEAIVAMLAVLKAGGYYIPLDSSLPALRLAALIRECRPRVIVTHTVLAQRLPPSVDRFVLDEQLQCLALASEQNVAQATGRSQLAYVLYTSGSTGTPKGVMVSIENLVHSTLARSAIYPEPVERYLLLSPLSFDSSVAGIYWTLFQGGSLHIASTAVLADPEAIVQLLVAQRISHLLCLPSLYALLLAQLRGEPLAVRTAIVAGEPCSRELPSLHRARLPAAALWNEYGPTEATVFCSAQRCDTWHEHSVPIGHAVEGYSLHVLDRELRPVPSGVLGELYVGGQGVARGYLGRAELTAERFVPDLFGTPGARLYRTGDLVRRRDDGALEFCGRHDGQVKLRGHRIELDEVELALAACGGVKRAAVALLSRGAQARLTAYVEGTSSWSSLRDELARRLPEVMIPARWVRMTAWPASANGKLDRGQLPDDGATVPVLSEPPVGPLEHQLAALLRELLEVGEIGRHDDFFALGMHSLLLPRLALGVRDVLGVSLPLRALLEHRSVAALAARIARPGTAMDDTPMAADLHGDARLDASIVPPPGACVVPPREVLLTGATGFLGTHLLAELLQTTGARVHCLMRVATSADGIARLRKNLQQYDLHCAGFDERVVVWPGDLREHQLGLGAEDHRELAERIDAIYHNGAHVDFNLPYSALKPANVLGTESVLRLACAVRPKSVHHISTLSVFPDAPATDGSSYAETEPTDPTRLETGYAQSKWVAEQLIWRATERGLAASVYRPGTITANRQTGAWNPNDYLCRVLATCVELGLAPDQDETLALVPVDHVSQAVVRLSCVETSPRAFHLLVGEPVGSRQLLLWLQGVGYALEFVSYDRWRRAAFEVASARPTHPLHPFAHLLAGADDSTPNGAAQYDCRRTQRTLQQLQIAPALLEREAFELSLHALVAGGHLQPPHRPK